MENYKVLRSVKNYHLVSKFTGVSHVWYVDNESGVSEDIGILDADSLITYSDKKFILYIVNILN